VVGPEGAEPGAVSEQRLRRLAERDRDDARALGQPLARAQVERHPCPARRVDLRAQGDEGVGLRVGRDALLVAVALVLPADDGGRVERAQRVEDGVLGGHERLRVERLGRLHGHEGEHLEEMGDDHVTEGARLLVEAAAPAHRELLGDVDLHVLDVVGVPDGLEEAVGEAQGEDVLRRLLAEEVVDAQDLALVEVLVQHRVELARGREVAPERLLGHDPRPLGEAGLAEHVGHAGRRSRRHAEVMQTARLAAERAVGVRDRGLQPAGVGLGHVREPLREGAPGVVRDRHAGELVERLAREVPEAGVVDVVERRADHPVVLRQQTRLREVEQARQELAASEVARRAEEHDDVRLRARRRADGGVAGLVGLLGHGSREGPRGPRGPIGRRGRAASTRGPGRGQPRGGTTRRMRSSSPETGEP